MNKDQIIKGLIFGIILFFVVSATAFITAKFINSPKINDESLTARLKKYEREYKYFTEEMTSQDIVSIWIEKFKDIKYKKGGNYSFNYLDCIGGFWIYSESLGYKNDHKDTKNIIQDLKNHNAKRRRKKFDVHANDLIFFYDWKRNPHHMGVVLGLTNSGLVQYVDINGKNLGWGVREENFYNKKIEIYQIPFTMWIDVKN